MKATKNLLQLLTKARSNTKIDNFRPKTDFLNVHINVVKFAMVYY